MTPFPFGRFLLVDRVAVGGMAEVYAGVDRRDPAGRLFAVKRMLPTLADDREFVRMFLHEALLVTQLAHPGIVPIHELGRIGAGYYMAMEWVAGRDLRALAARFRASGEPVPVHLAAFLVARAADALDHAHRGRGSDGAELKVVHRDVSPGNVLVGFDGRVRVIDFGIAQAAHSRRRGAEVLRGKFGYMSPELVGGEAVDRRSDVFGLGIILHELLTGARLFKGPTELATMERVREAAVRPPSETRAAVPPGLDAVVLRALARDPAARYQWASDLALALAPFAGCRGPGGGCEVQLAALMADWFPEELRAEDERRLRAREAAA